jgi:hypothetical protein
VLIESGGTPNKNLTGAKTLEYFETSFNPSFVKNSIIY